MSDLVSAVVLCDLPNLQRRDFIKGGKDFEGNKRMVVCLDIICEYMQRVLGLATDNKWLFGDVNMYDYIELLLAFYNRDWKYIVCPAVIKEGKPVSISDEVLATTFHTFMKNMPECKHYVFITDDGDFIPEMESCLEHGYDVTLFVSGMHKHRFYKARLKALQEKGVRVVNLRDLVKERDVALQQELKQLETLEREIAEEQPSPAVIPMIKTKPSTEKACPPSLVSPLERFHRRYGRAT